MYKRQCSICYCRCAKFFHHKRAQSALEHPDAVSYTHLDVYKRQHQRRLIDPGSLDRLHQPLHFRIVTDTEGMVLHRGGTPNQGAARRPRHPGKDSRRTGGQPSLDLNLIESQRSPFGRHGSTAILRTYSFYTLLYDLFSLIILRHSYEKLSLQN